MNDFDIHVVGGEEILKHISPTGYVYSCQGNYYLELYGEIYKNVKDIAVKAVEYLKVPVTIFEIDANSRSISRLDVTWDSEKEEAVTVSDYADEGYFMEIDTVTIIHAVSQLYKDELPLTAALKFGEWEDLDTLREAVKLWCRYGLTSDNPEFFNKLYEIVGYPDWEDFPNSELFMDSAYSRSKLEVLYASAKEHYDTPEKMKAFLDEHLED